MRSIKSIQSWNNDSHWGRAKHICVGKLTTIGSDNVLSPGRRQAIIWTIAGILLIGPLGTNFSEILIGIQTFSFKKMHLKMSSAKWRPSCLSLNVLNHLCPHPSITKDLCLQMSWCKQSNYNYLSLSVYLKIFKTTRARNIIIVKPWLLCKITHWPKPYFLPASGDIFKSWEKIRGSMLPWQSSNSIG